MHKTVNNLANAWYKKQGSSPNVANDRAVRGGSWNNNARNTRAAYRNHNEPDNADNNLGFRCLRAHAGAGWPKPEQDCFQSVIADHGKKVVSGGVLVARQQPLERSLPVYSSLSNLFQ